MILGIIQARVSSSRLPGKILKPILGRPMLAHQIDRVRRAKRLDDLVVATSQNTEDNPIETLCEELGARCYRGSLTDVLDRFYQTAKPLNAEHVVRITGDCPLIDPSVIDATVDFHLVGRYDYTSNALEPTFPDGLDTEVIRFASLETAWKRAQASSEREHVTSYLYNHRDQFHVGIYKNSSDLSALRWTVDETADFDFVRSVYEALYPDNPRFAMSDILSLLETSPQLKALNSMIPRNAGYRP